MPVIDDKTKRLMKAVNDKKHYERIADRLAKANEMLIGEIETLRARIAELEGSCDRKSNVMRQTIGISLKRAKQLEAIKRILNGEFVLDTSGDSPKMVKAGKEKPLMFSRAKRKRIDHI